jgi:hypothetical protein
MNGVSVYPLPLSCHLLTPIKAWISWLNLSVLLGTLALALFNASEDVVARQFAYAYALISIGVLVNARTFAICDQPMLMLRDLGLWFCNLSE